MLQSHGFSPEVCRSIGASAFNRKQYPDGLRSDANARRPYLFLSARAPGFINSMNATLFELGGLQLDGTRLGAGGPEPDGIDEAGRVGRIGIGGKRDRFQRDEPALGEVERAGGAALVVREVDDDLAAV